jgi:hypothetical protein
MRLRHDGDTHWFIYTTLTGQRIDAVWHFGAIVKLWDCAILTEHLGSANERRRESPQERKKR